MASVDIQDSKEIRVGDYIEYQKHHIFPQVSKVKRVLEDAYVVYDVSMSMDIKIEKSLVTRAMRFNEHDSQKQQERDRAWILSNSLRGLAD